MSPLSHATSAHAATYYGPLKGRISLTLYLVMGWTALACIKDIANVLPPAGLFWLVTGGVLYTVGVPFFVMDSDPTRSMYHGKIRPLLQKIQHSVHRAKCA